MRRGGFTSYILRHTSRRIEVQPELVKRKSTEKGVLCSVGWVQTPSPGLRHLSFNTAVFGYAIGFRKLSANEQFFLDAQNSSRFVANNSDYIKRLFYN